MMDPHVRADSGGFDDEGSVPGRLVEGGADVNIVCRNSYYYVT